jgi:nitrite reductase/ring-hydroxylating ferredoxin subunit
MGPMEGTPIMSMTRDAYAKELIKVAVAALFHNEAVICPHEGCDQRLSVVRQSMFSTRSLFCPVHGHIFQEQSVDPHSKLNWDRYECRLGASESDWDDEEESEGQPGGEQYN